MVRIVNIHHFFCLASDTKWRYLMLVFFEIPRRYVLSG